MVPTCQWQGEGYECGAGLWVLAGLVLAAGACVRGLSKGRVEAGWMGPAWAIGLRPDRVGLARLAVAGLG